MADIKSFTVRIDMDIYKKLKVKATLNEKSTNDYLRELIADDVADVDLSNIIK